jgi:hypothetical protein
MSDWPEQATTTETIETAQGNTVTVTTTAWPNAVTYLVKPDPAPPGGD